MMPLPFNNRIATTIPATNTANMSQKPQHIFVRLLRLRCCSANQDSLGKSLATIVVRKAKREGGRPDRPSVSCDELRRAERAGRVVRDLRVERRRERMRERVLDVCVEGGRRMGDVGEDGDGCGDSGIVKVAVEAGVCCMGWYGCNGAVEEQDDKCKQGEGAAVLGSETANTWETTYECLIFSGPAAAACACASSSWCTARLNLFQNCGSRTVPIVAFVVR
jgi:hypothetical protein